MRTSTQRLERLRKPLEGTQFGFRELDGYIEATCPWGNRIRCFRPNERFGRITPYRRLVEKGLVTQESDQHQYRFQDISRS